VKFDDATEWEKIICARLTPDSSDSLHVRSFQFPLDRTPTALRFETWGYGTQGIVFVEIVNAKGRFVPSGLTSVKGKVIEPENVLADSIYYAVAGENYTRENFNNHQSYSNRKRHGFGITLKNEQGDHPSHSTGQEGPQR
jgi:hypothetical protein